MPFHFEFDREHRILLIVVEGDYRDTEMLLLIGAIRKQADELNPSAGITDFSLVTSFSVSSNAIRTAAGEPSPFKDPTPRFVVAPLDIAFGMFRMYQSHGERTRAELHLVRTREEALAALGVQDPKFERVGSP
jgi:hypothetical protein